MATILRVSVCVCTLKSQTAYLREHKKKSEPNTDLNPCTLYLCLNLVEPRDQPSRAQHPHDPGGHQAGSARGEGDTGQAAREAHDADYLPSGPADGQGDLGGALPRVLGTDPEGAQERL